MNLSSDTLSLLKNFSEINQGILVKPGNTIKTISNMKNILAEAQISETFSSLASSRAWKGLFDTFDDEGFVEHFTKLMQLLMEATPG